MKEQTEYCITGELAKARRKFLGNKHQFAALVEEVGELGKALLELERGGDAYDVYAEAIQCAAMAIRVLEDGDSDFPDYSYLPEFYQKYPVT